LPCDPDGGAVAVESESPSLPQATSRVAAATAAGTAVRTRVSKEDTVTDAPPRVI
jgi:hypothetical protein